MIYKDIYAAPGAANNIMEFTIAWEKNSHKQNIKEWKNLFHLLVKHGPFHPMVKIISLKEKLFLSPPSEKVNLFTTWWKQTH